MAGLHDKCPECGKVARSVRELRVQKDGRPVRLVVLECKHILILEAMKSSAERLREWKSLDGRTPYEFQIEGILNIEANDGVHGLFDQMGLGKTIQAFGFAWLHKEEVTPTLIICKSGLKVQLQHEWYRWVGYDQMVYVVESTIERCWPGFACYIISYDILQHFQKKHGKDHWKEFLFGDLKFNLFIIDEVQQIKSPDSKRTQLVRSIVKSHAGDKRRIIPLSGTPWKNNFGEAFVVMNLLDPLNFSAETRFISEWCDTYYSSSGSPKIGGLRPECADWWREKTKHLITRRLRSEVGLQLPSVNRLWRYIDLEEIHKKAYGEQVIELLDYMDSVESDNGGMSFAAYSNILAMLSRLRHIAGLSKVKPTVEFLEEFLLEEPSEKIVVFTHHLDVAEILLSEIGRTLADGGYAPPLHFKAGASFWDLTEEFKKPESRVAIASTLAAGEGLNLQFCSRAVMLERQWNPPNEEQAESRFTRIGSTASQVDVTYMLAIGTVDDYFTEIVERKRVNLKRSHGEHTEELEERALVMELVKVLQAKGRQMWRLR